MLADRINTLQTVAATSPLSVGGGGLVVACGAVCLLTRLPEFLMMAAIAAVYAGVALLPV